MQRALASVRKHNQLLGLIRSYEDMGHLIADVDPLGHAKNVNDLSSAPFLIDHVKSLKKETYGFNNDDLDGFDFDIDRDDIILGHLAPRAPLRKVIQSCQGIFCSKIGSEFTHIVDRDAQMWIRKKLVDIYMDNDKMTRNERRRIYELLARAELFETFCGRRFSGAKRFSLEGSESLIPGIESLVIRAAELGVKDIEVGMAHRGRLNFLMNIMDVPLYSIVSDFEPYLPDDEEHPNNSNDVRYHLGTTSVRKYPVNSGLATLLSNQDLGGKKHKGKNQNDIEIRLSLAANPSHLEAVNSVVLGKTRARQFLLRGNIHEGNIDDGPLGRSGSVDYSPSDTARLQVMALLIHGDASFFQGGVRESLGFSNLRDYTTGGTVHIIVNNQIGFTTLPKESHSSTYCSDVAKSIGAPVFHVNGDDPDKVVQVCRMAVEYRQRFGRDAFVNLWCYRRHGHNEQDTPEVTQPHMYRAIRAHEPLLKAYGKQLKNDSESPIPQKELDDIIHKITRDMDEGYAKVKSGLGAISVWNEMKRVDDYDQEIIHTVDKTSPEFLDPYTGVTKDLLKKAGRAMFTLPPPSEFHAHSKVESIMADRLRSIESGKGFRWATAEALAWASLLIDGYHIRLSGQDVERGTFNQRHAVVYDQSKDHYSKTGSEKYYKPWTALQNMNFKSFFEPPSSNNNSFATSATNPIATSISSNTGNQNESDLTKQKLKPQMSTKLHVLHGEPSAVAQRGAWGLELSRRKSGLQPCLGVMEICNSPLSEEGVLAFEHGYSLYSHHLLVMWEAQFGDFANCAQSIIDTFISGGEDKWMRPSGIVLLLPHGPEGQGPDHSSAYVERWLQLCAEDENWDGKTSTMERAQQVNMHVIMPSTPAQYFHALRRQMLLPYRKPLIIFTPKYLLHHRPCASTLEEMGPKTKYKYVIDDSDFEPNGLLASKREGVKRIILCSGKLYYRLRHSRTIMRHADGSTGKTSATDIAIVRMEQFCPFPFEQVEKILCNQYPNATEIVWAQEEPKNMGAWSFVQPRLHMLLQKNNQVKKVQYIGRSPSSSPGTGTFEIYQLETEKLVSQILNLKSEQL